MYFKVMSQEEHKDDAALPAKCEEIGGPCWNSANGQDTDSPTIICKWHQGSTLRAQQVATFVYIP